MDLIIIGGSDKMIFEYKKHKCLFCRPCSWSSCSAIRT